MDLLPRDVWDDFQSAQSNIQNEIECVMRENAKFQFNWGPPHKLNIFSKARELHEKKMMVQNKVFQQRQQMQRQGMQRPGQAQTSAPNARSFGSGMQSGFLNSSPNKPKKLTKRE